MILLNFGLVLAAVTLLIVGLGTGDVGLVWASVGASVIAAACLAFVATARRRGGLVEPSLDGDSGGGGDGGVVSAAAGRVPKTRPAEDSSQSRRPPTQPTAASASGSPPTSPSTSQPGSPAGSSPESPPAASPTSPASPPVPLSGAEPESGDPEEHPAAEDAALVADRDDLVLVVDGRPRYHLFTCPPLTDRDTVPLAVSQARRDGFTPCGRCTPDATLARAVRELADGDA